MKNFMDAMYIKALVAAGQAQNRMQELWEEDEGLDVLITIILVAVGLVLVAIIAKYATSAVSDADSKMDATSKAVGGIKSSY